MQSGKVERVRGVSDALPDEVEAAARLQAALASHVEAAGYRPIGLPIVEYSDLYLRKSGEEVVTRLYDFTHQNRRLSLRPELVASTIRAYVEHFRDAPLPVRLYSVGPVFRYEKPGRGRARQFTQLGVELIGAAGAMADAELIATACGGLDRVGLRDYRLVLGHVAILGGFLEGLGLDDRLRRFLPGQMEPLRREGRGAIERRLSQMIPRFRPGAAPEADAALSDSALRDLFGAMGDEEARRALGALLSSLGIELGGTREPEEIIDRLLVKMRRQDQSGLLDRALDFMGELGQLRGEPFEVLRAAEALVATHGLSGAPLAELRTLLATLRYHEIGWERLSLDLGLSRGLQYTTGMTFEIHHGAPGEERQLCGGGRYDGLVTLLGGKEEAPAAGFAYGLERIQEALRAEGALPGAARDPVELFVIPVGAESHEYAVKIAARLRASDIRTEIDVRGRSVTANLQYASRRAIPLVAIVGPDEIAASTVVLRDMRAREERRVALVDLIPAIEEARAAHE